MVWKKYFWKSAEIAIIAIFWSLSHITLELGISAHSKKNKTLECGNHYNVSILPLHANTESPVHVQPLLPPFRITNYLFNVKQTDDMS